MRHLINVELYNMSLARKLMALICFVLLTRRWMIHPHTVNAFYDRVTNKISEYFVNSFYLLRINITFHLNSNN